jgi:hypothetical protein
VEDFSILIHYSIGLRFFVDLKAMAYNGNDVASKLGQLVY